MERIVVGSFTPSVLLDLATSTGRLAAQGIDVVEVSVASSPAQFRSLLAGDLDVALTSPDNVLAYRFDPENPLGELADVHIVAAMDRGLGLGLYARPGLTVDDLRGASVGVDVPTSGFALALYALADSLGVSRDEYDVVPLGSTPRRLEALLAGDCSATMLNAGNEIVAEDAGCARLAAAGEVCAPYLGTVVAVAGERSLATSSRLASAMTQTAAALLDGELAAEAAESAERRLGLSGALAGRYVECLLDPAAGLVADGAVDLPSLETLVGLRRTYLPRIVEGVDLLAPALDAGSGLVRRA